MSKISKADRKVIKAIIKTMRDDAVVSEDSALEITKSSPTIHALFSAMAAEERRQRRERKTRHKEVNVA